MPTAKDIVKNQKLRKKIAVSTRAEDIGSVFDALDRETDMGICNDIPPELDVDNEGLGVQNVTFEDDVVAKRGGRGGGRGGGKKSSGGGGASAEKSVSDGFAAIQKELQDIRAERRRLTKDLNSSSEMDKDERDDLKLRNSLLDSREQSVREELKLFYKKELTELGQVRKIRIVIEDYMRPVPAVTSAGDL